MATARKCRASTTETKFVGPAQQYFDSLLDLATFSLDTNCPRWRDYENPESYIVPPLFYYKRADKSDQDFDSAQAEVAVPGIDKGAISKAKPDEFNLVKDRGSDEAEHIVYKAIEQLIQEKIQAPFVAVHSFNIDRVQYRLQELFPWINTATIKAANSCFREYDFVLIGPKIGIVVIEVKHAFFTQKKHFTPGNRFLPDDFLGGLQQLKAFDNVIELLQKCSDVKIVKEKVKKILFTPNLERKRFSGWYNDLDTLSKGAINEKLQNANERWFLEDTQPSENTGMPRLYHVLCNVLHGNGAIQLPDATYEAFCPLFAGFAAVTIFSSKIGLEIEKLSEGEALMKESQRIESQDPAGRLEPSTAPKRPKKQKVDQPETVKLDKVIILTPDQKAALEGPNRQFIVGPAGTGKTIILQVKALEMLKEGKSVFVFCPPWFEPKYKELFDQNGFTNYEIQSSWTELIEGTNPAGVLNDVQDLGLDAYQLVAGLLNDSDLSEYLKKAKFVEVLSNYDGLFIDDMMDRHDWSRDVEEPSTTESRCFSRTADVFFALIITSFAKILCPDKTVWIAFDFWNDYDHNIYWKSYLKNQKFITKFFTSGLEISSSTDNYYTLTKLNRIMRCPENVFRAAYKFGDGPGPAVKPQLGHKIQGRHRKINVYCKTEDEGLESSWQKIKEVLKDLSKKNISFDNVCLILGQWWTASDDCRAGPFLLKKCEEDDIRACCVRTTMPPTYEYTAAGLAAVGKFDKEILKIYDSGEISSSEWPIIIFVDYLDFGRSIASNSDFIRYDYRARSRATAELIEIVAIRNSDVPNRHRSLSDSIGNYSKLSR